LSKKRVLADHYSVRAGKEGYPARSVYKLEEIEKKFSVINTSAAVLDVGAAPGSWSIYISRLMRKKNSRAALVAVDLKEMSFPRETRVTSLVGDAFSTDMLEKIRALGPYGTVVSDAAPSTTGNRTVDTGRSFTLAQSLLELASDVLLPGGNLVVKIFQGGNEGELKARALELFDSVKMLKPKACRKDSFETFLVGTGRKREENDGESNELP
jgi:23S rRNA (uridine2552-2'-O)-methyltransferase